MTEQVSLHRSWAAFDALRLPSNGTDTGPGGVFNNGFGELDRAALHALLTRIHCPPVCLGKRDPTRDIDWHESCENAATQAIAALDADWRLGAITHEESTTDV